MKKYSDSEVNDFLELAQEVGITKAIRDLGYPNSWSTAQYWAKKRGVEVAADPLKSKAAAQREWYKDDEAMEVIREGMNRVHEELMTNKDLSADDQKKLSEAFAKYYNSWANLMGKQQVLGSPSNADEVEDHISELLAMQRANNMLKKEDMPQS